MGLRLFFLILILNPIWASAQYLDSLSNKSRPLSIDVKYLTFNDIQTNASSPRKEIAPELAISANLRFYRTFSFCVMMNQSMNKSIDSISGYGLGLRVDLPGIFFINGMVNDLVRKRKRRDINTYFQWGKLQITESNAQSYVADRMAFGLDGFIAGDLYLAFEAAIYSHQGNQFISPGVGIGYEF